MVLLYFTGILVGVLAALLLKSTVFKGEAGALCHGAAQLPPARPEKRGAAAVGKGQGLLAEGLYGHLCRYHRHLVPADFDLRCGCADPQASILARIAGDIAPLFAPLGFADWRISTALISGFMAKESVVSSLLILFGSTAALTAALTPAQAAPLLVFCLLYTPCIAAVASVKRSLAASGQPSWW